MAAEATRRRAVTYWRNWSLPTKLATIMLVPVLFAVTLSVSQINWQVQRADQYDRVGRVLDAVDRVEGLVASAQDERTQAVQWLGGIRDPATRSAKADAVDGAAKAMKELFPDSEMYGPVVKARYDEARAQLDRISDVRRQVDAGQLDPPRAIQAYSGVTSSLLSLDRALISSLGDPSLSSTATALQDLLVMMEEVRLQQVWVLTGLSQGSLSPQALDTLHGSRARLFGKLGEARATLPAHWQERLDSTMSGAPILDRNKLLTTVLVASSDDVFSGSFPVSPADWNASSDTVMKLIDQGHSDLANDVRATAWRLEEEASNAAGRDSVILLSALLAAAAVGITIARQLLGSLRLLRRSALDAAEYDLPTAVANIREGDDTETAIAPVPVETSDEVGQVARAFDAVNRQALRLAAEQSTLRRGYSDSFVSVSRRSQSLVERQLRLFEQLEQNEEDPDQLATLFQLDNLATRMRRNNENLMVLTGSDLARRFVQPTALADVLQSAVSEIEQYPRVVVQPPPSVQLVGHAASDLVRLVAELLDNATNFSSPDTSVTVSSYHAGDRSITIDIVDDGIGMGEAELAEANERLGKAEETDLATSRRLGLFVAGRLAARHGVLVQLHGGPNVEGVRATVHIPPEHVVSDTGPSAHRTPPAHGPGRNGFAHHDMPTSGAFSLPTQDAEPAAQVPPQAPPPEPNFPRSAYESSVIDRGDSPTANLFTPPVDLPEPEPTGSDFSWTWPEPSDDDQWGRYEEPSWGGYEEPSSQPSYDVHTQWFQPTGEDAHYQAMAQVGHDDFGWPSGEGDGLPPSEMPSETPPQGTPLTTASSASIGEEPHHGFEEHHAEVSARSEPPSLTSSGLPRRTPRAQAASGGAAADRVEESAGEQGDQRSPEDISRRLAEFHNGVHFGQSSTAEPQPEAGLTDGEQAWNFATDDAMKRAQAATSLEPTSYTSSGLPRRVPRAQLAPGSAPRDQEDGAQDFHRNPDRLRGRLADFQSGARRGRHRAPDEG